MLSLNQRVFLIRPWSKAKLYNPASPGSRPASSPFKDGAMGDGGDGGDAGSSLERRTSLLSDGGGGDGGGGAAAGPSIFAFVGGLITAPATRAAVPRLTAVMGHQLHWEPCTHLAFTQEGVLTACAGGVVKLWRRPEHADN